MQQVELKAGPGEVAPDGPAQLSALRRELAQYRCIFDSARLVIGHEFARPLTSAMGYLELLEERRGDALDERERAYIAKIRAALARLGEIVDSFVEMLRIEHEGAGVAARERIDVRGLAEGVRERFDDEAARITVNVPADLPPVVARRRSLEVVLENLVSNAVKHGQGRPVVVSASLAPDRRADAGARRLVLAVEDRGEGIPNDKIEDIFKPFFRIDDGRARSGLGLGLALVKSIVTSIKGEIHVRSKPGDGTTVTVVVPIDGDGAIVPDTAG